MAEKPMELDEQLNSLAVSNLYPFHMPGHKRNMKAFADPYSIDITEISDFDNLHDASGILKAAQQRAADLYGVRRAWYLVNGSTCGLLAAVSAALPKRGKLLVARNCHKAVYHAMYLREITPVYLYPEITSRGLQGQITPETVAEALKENPDAAAVLITSPTYDGVLSDVAAIADLAHAKGIPLIVDQAHGAHFGLASQMPVSAAQLGADLVVVSLHKTLPAYTQTALLLAASDRVSGSRIDEFLDIYETSSPSYLLMAGMERCVRIMRTEGADLLQQMSGKLEWFYEKVSRLNYLKVLRRKDFRPEEAWDFDESKILILCSGAGISGETLAEILRQDYAIEPEMAAPAYVLALASLMDTEEGFCRLAYALTEIDRRLDLDLKEFRKQQPLVLPSELYIPVRRACQIHEIEEMGYHIEEKTGAEAAGQISGAYVYLYPPGIPLLVPGEEITDRMVTEIRRAREAGFSICGTGTSREELTLITAAEAERAAERN